jgi:hypothetical protein
MGPNERLRIVTSIRAHGDPLLSTTYFKDRQL